MVRTQQIANLLNGKLNTIATAKGVNKQFKLKAHLGKTDGGNIINGILKPTTGTPYEKGGTGSGTNGAVVTYVASLVFPTSIDNSFATIVEDIVTTLIEQEHGGSFTINGGKAVWEMTYGVPEGFDIRDVVGSSMPISFTVKLSFGSTGLLNGIKAWTLDGHPIPYSKEAVILDRFGKTISIDEAKDQQTIPTAQAKQFKFTIPYDSTNVVCTTLKNDILMGAFTKTYQLTYDDGAVQFTKTVTLYANGDTGTNGTGENTILTVSFVEAGGNEFVDADGNTIRYQIALVNWDFSDTSENTLYFASQSAQQTFMTNLATNNASSDWMPFNAPSLNNVLETTVEVQKDDANVPEKVLDYNYAIIQRTTTDTENVSTNEYFYYFVSQATAGAFGMVSLALKMDTIQTYLFNPNIEFADCMIERAHLNRWEEMLNDATKIRFANRKDNPILLAEPNVGDSGKTCTARTNLAFSWTGISDVDRWLTANISYWVYAYVDTTNIDYIVDTYNSNAKISGADTVVGMKSIDGSEYKYPYGVFCYPVYRNNSKVIKFLRAYPGTTAISKTLDITDFSNFLDRNGGTSHIFCIKASIVPPFGGGYYFAPYTTTNPDTVNMGNEIYIDGNGDLILEQTNANALGTNGYINLTDANGNLCCRLTASSTINTSIHLFTAPQQIIQSFNSYNANDFTTPIFNKTDIIGANHNAEYNPKMYQTDFVEYHLKDNAGYDYVYDKSKARTQYGIAKFLYSEALQPEITRYYCRYNSSESIYSYFMTEDYTGLAGSIDTTLSLAVDSYDNFIANNRNFWLQTLLGFGLNIAGSGIKSTNPVAGATSAGLSLFDSAFALSDRLFTKSNLEQAPDSIRNTSGSILGNLQIAPMAIFLETWSAYDTTSITADTYMHLNGYIYNQVDSVLNYIHTRKYFNYIKADITDILGLPLSNIIRADIQQRFSNGLRFWNVDTYQQYGLQYDKENYELWLEN